MSTSDGPYGLGANNGPEMITKMSDEQLYTIMELATEWRKYTRRFSADRQQASLYVRDLTHEYAIRCIARLGMWTDARGR